MAHGAVIERESDRTVAPSTKCPIDDFLHGHFGLAILQGERCRMAHAAPVPGDMFFMRKDNIG